MRLLQYLFVVSSVAVSACSGHSSASRAASQAPSDTMSPVTRGTGTERLAVNQNLREFAPDIPAFAEGGECQTRQIPGRGRDVGIAFPSVADAIRSVWLTYGDNGDLINYSDTRGDLVMKVTGLDGGPPRPNEPIRTVPPVGRQTAIHMNLQNNVVLARNHGGDREAVAAAGSSQSGLTAENLGSPMAVIEMVTARCGK